jgi:hypothetical protein
MSAACTIDVAGRIAPKTSPWAPDGLHWPMSVTNIRVRTASSKARASLLERGRDVLQHLPCARAGVGRLRSGRLARSRWSRDVHVLPTHRAGITDDRFHFTPEDVLSLHRVAGADPACSDPQG